MLIKRSAEQSPISYQYPGDKGTEPDLALRPLASTRSTVTGGAHTRQPQAGTKLQSPQAKNQNWRVSWFPCRRLVVSCV